MKKISTLLFIAGGSLLAAACSDNVTTPVTSALAASALRTAPISFNQINSSFVGSSDANDGFEPGSMNGTFDDGDHHDGDHEEGDHNDRGPGWSSLMGGGIADVFRGRILFGLGLGRGPFGDLRNATGCAFSSTDSRVTCAAVARGGLTINRSFSYLDAAGAVQQAFDTGTTNTVNARSTVTGTKVHHDDDTSTVNSKSDITVTGLATASTQRTVNGTASGTESTVGTKRDGVKFTAMRVAGDTVTGVIIPLQNGRPTFPTAGTIVRSMQATVTLDGQTPTTSSRREVITFDGTNTAQISVTQDGVTKTGTLSLTGEGLNCH
ncbi:MAG TPA: hypothetical protein VGN73_08110 [Gemmatimonadaceae bacterium]|jgi:hypothetical protein|nr:hypothetical protein [Gemmatimonadaceae bacterium]